MQQHGHKIIKLGEEATIKILLATYWLIPHVGGCWKFMSEVAKGLEALGHEVDLLGNSPDYDKFHIINKGLELSKSHLKPMLDAKLSAPRYQEVLKDPYIRLYEYDRYVMELSAAYFGLGGYDIIHTQDIFSARALSRVKPAGTPLITHLHGSVMKELHNYYRTNPHLQINEQSNPWKYFSSAEYHAAMSAYPVITANHWQKNNLVTELNIPEERIKVFQYGIDEAKFWSDASAYCEIQKPVGKKVIIFPARLVFVKGIDVLITALHLVKMVRQDFVCWIVGDGDLREKLENQVASLGLQEDVLFLGERHDVPALLLKSDIFVHSCLQDNQPYSLMEAQIAGLPACVSNAGGLPEMVEHSVTGLVSEVGDAVALSQHLQLLLEHDDLRRVMGSQAKAWGSEHWSMNNMIQRLLNEYNLAIHS